MSEDRGEQRLRLEELYGAMGDGELEELAARPEDLTEAASAVLAAELGRRGMEAPARPEAGGREGFAGAAGMPAAGDRVPENLGATGPQMELITLYDALAAGRACEFLEEAGISFHVADVSGPEDGRGSFDGGPAVALRITVGMDDVARAQTELRRQMGLFPLESIAVPDELVDDGTRTSVGYFGTRGEAEEIAGVLRRAGLWNAVVEDTEGGEHPFAVEVREMDLFAAGDVVEKALEG
ncbi:MAG: hypothetical protein M3O02_10865 [Acidobacteriota bacterium]|nr:hypothetical protein [Acidobacteriota bacterium]